MKKWMVCVGILGVVGLGVGMSLWAAEGDGNSYADAKKCMKCHFKEYSAWKKQPKAKAFAAIENEADKELCYPCHTTGYGEPGGFVDPETTPELANVQCGSCHGPGANHVNLATAAKAAGGDVPPEVKAAIQRVPTTCANCHNPHIKDKAADVRKKAAG